jgi:hypothetical protein
MAAPMLTVVTVAVGMRLQKDDCVPLLGPMGP